MPSTCAEGSTSLMPCSSWSTASRTAPSARPRRRYWAHSRSPSSAPRCGSDGPARAGIAHSCPPPLRCTLRPLRPRRPAGYDPVHRDPVAPRTGHQPVVEAPVEAAFLFLDASPIEVLRDHFTPPRGPRGPWLPCRRLGNGPGKRPCRTETPAGARCPYAVPASSASRHWSARPAGRRSAA